MLPKRHARKMFAWLMRRATHTTPRGEVDSRTGYITITGGGSVPRPWRKVTHKRVTMLNQTSRV